MKKLLLGIYIFFLCGIVFTNSSYAQCRSSSVAQCGRGEVRCDLSGATWCCPQIAGGNSCSQVPGSVQPTIPPNGGLPASNINPQGNCGAESINTAIGCIPVGTTEGFAGWFLGWAVGIGGGIAFLLIVYASFMVMTSQGDPQRLKAGQELLTSAISGVIMLVFAVTILRFIGIDILGLNTL